MLQKTSFLKISTYWFFISLLLLISITMYTGIQIVTIAQTWGTPLHWRIHEWQTQTRIELEEAPNVFEQGIDELFSTVDQEMDLPDKLYISHSFELEFDRNGEIQSFYTYVFGENNEGLHEGFLIQLTSETNQITVREQEFVEQREIDERMLFSPLKETLNQLSLQEILQEWPNEERFGIYYIGYRTWGYNNAGIYYLENEEPVELTFATDEITGYTVSIFVSGKTEEITPKRYIDRSLNSLVENQVLEESIETTLGYQVDEKQQEMYFLTKDIGYRLPVIDAATGSRWYGLEKTEDGGETWATLNENPFDGRSGVSSGITFFSEKLGFIILSNANQTESVLFRTENGGETFYSVDFPDILVPLNDEVDYNPFQFPETPYEKNDRIVVLVGQGAHGDYHLGAKALYQSEDDGETWEFVEEINDLE